MFQPTDYIITLTVNGTPREIVSQSKLATTKKRAVDMLKAAYESHYGRGEHNVTIHTTVYKGRRTEQELKVGFMQEYDIVKDKEVFSL